MSDSLTIAVCYLIIGYWWGGWFAERKAKKAAENGDVALRFLMSMIETIRDSRKFVGPGPRISREEKFELGGQKFAISVWSEGDPDVFYEKEQGTNA